MFGKVVTNTLFQLLAKAVSVALTFLTTLFILRLGGPELFGDLTKALTLIAVGFTAIDFGLNAEAVRSMKGSLLSERRIFSSTILARALLSILAIIITNLVVLALPGGYTPAIKSVFWIGSVSILFQGFYTSANIWFQRRLTYWKMSVATILSAFTGAFLTYFAIYFRPDLGLLLAATTGGYVILGLSALFLAEVKFADFRNISSIVLPRIFRALPLGIILIMSILASKIDTIVLGIFQSSAEVGQYGFAYRIFDVVLVLPVFVMNSVYPLLVAVGDTSRKKDLISHSLRSLLFIAVFGIAALWLGAPLILHVRPGLESSVQVLRLLAFSLPFFYLTAPLMWQLVEARQEKYLIAVYTFAAITNFVFNWIFVPVYGLFASAVLTGFTEFVILLGLLFVRRIALTKH